MSTSAFGMNLSLDQARDEIGLLDTARCIPVHCEKALMDGGQTALTIGAGDETFTLPSGTELENIDDWQAVVNDTTGSVVNMVSDKYALIQHSMAADIILNGLADTGLGSGAKFQVVDEGNRVRIRARFPDVVVNDGSRDGLQLGVQFDNSYDSTSSLRGRMMAWRAVCQNGLYIGKTVPGTSFSVRHIGGAYRTADAAEKVEKFTDNIVGAVGKVNDLVEIARSTVLTFENDKQVALTLQSILDRVRLPQIVVESIPINEGITTYDLLNKITYYASNDPAAGSTYSREKMITLAANKILGNPNLEVIYMDPSDDSPMKFISEP